MYFELERILLDQFGGSVMVVDEVSGFRYFDARDLLGFVDGTANPSGIDLPAASLGGDEDADFAGGSYIVVQKYLHDMQAWARTPSDVRKAIIGRTKIDNIEIDEDAALIEKMLQRQSREPRRHALRSSSRPRLRSAVH